MNLFKKKKKKITRIILFYVFKNLIVFGLNLKI